MVRFTNSLSDYLVCFCDFIYLEVADYNCSLFLFDVIFICLSLMTHKCQVCLPILN